MSPLKPRRPLDNDYNSSSCEPLSIEELLQRESNETLDEVLSVVMTEDGFVIRTESNFSLRADEP